MAVCGMESAGTLRYLLFPHQTGWSPARLSTYFSTLYKLWSNWLSYFSLRSPFFVSTICAVLSKVFGVVLKFILELVAPLRRMSFVFGDEDLSRQAICASERSFTVSSSTFFSVSSKIVDVVVKVDHLSVKHFSV